MEAPKAVEGPLHIGVGYWVFGPLNITREFKGLQANTDAIRIIEGPDRVICGRRGRPALMSPLGQKRTFARGVFFVRFWG